MAINEGLQIPVGARYNTTVLPPAMFGAAAVGWDNLETHDHNRRHRQPGPAAPSAADGMEAEVRLRQEIFWPM